MGVGNEWYHCQFCYFSIIFFAPSSVWQVSGGNHWVYPGNQSVCLSDGTQNTFTVLQIRTFPYPLLRKIVKNKLKLSVRNLFRTIERGDWVRWVWAMIDTTDSFVIFLFFAPSSVWQVSGGNHWVYPGNQSVCLSDGIQNISTVLQIRTFPSSLLRKNCKKK